MNTHSDRSVGVKKVFDIGTIVVFAGLLIAPAIDLLVRDDVARGPGPELRTAAAKPEVPNSLTSLATFPKHYERHWNDTFGLRDKFLRAHSAFKVFALNTSPDDTHVIGKNRWIYNDNSEIIDSWRGVLPMTTEQLENWRKRLERRRDAARELGAHYVFTIAPDKPTIYPEYVPERFNKVGPSRMDQFYEYMRAHSDVDMFDMRPALLAEKLNDTLADPAKGELGDFVYYRLGTHWEPRGAIAAFNAFIEHLQPRFPAMRKIPLEDHKPYLTGRFGDSEGRNMYIADLLPQREVLQLLPEPKRYKFVERLDRPSRAYYATVDDPSLPSVVMYHDSFASFYLHEWSESCSRLAMFWAYDWDLRAIAAEEPDLIIDEMVERTLFGVNVTRVAPSEARTRDKVFAESKVVLYKFKPLDVDASLRAVHPASASAGSDEVGAFARLTTEVRRSGFELVGLTSAVKSRVIASCDVEFDGTAGEQGEVRLYWRSEGDEVWSDERSIAAPVTAGRNRFSFEFFTGDKPLKDILFDPLDEPGSCKLRALELRSEVLVRPR